MGYDAYPSIRGRSSYSPLDRWTSSAGGAFLFEGDNGMSENRSQSIPPLVTRLRSITEKMKQLSALYKEDAKKKLETLKKIQEARQKNAEANRG